MRAARLYLDNTMRVDLIGLADQDGTPINNALASVRVVNAAGTAVAGQTWPATMAYVTNSDGDYRAILDEAIEIVEGALYTVEVTATTADNQQAYWEELALAEVRR